MRRNARKRLIRFATPFERRMIYFSKLHSRVPPEGSLDGIRLKKLMEMDVGFQVRMRALEQRLSMVLDARMKGGSGLQMSNLLRSYFHEYLNRYAHYGPTSLPTSFNVVESFMSFDREFWFFDLLSEKEHLLSIDDYFRWYEKREVPRNTSLLRELLPNDVIHSYDMICDRGSLRICGASQQVFAGVSLVRRGDELSCILLAGENPPRPDIKISDFITEGLDLVHPTRKGMRPHPELTAENRYLEGFPGFAKIVVLTRIDIKAGTHCVRYINLDLGPCYSVFTDDGSVFSELREDERLRQIALTELVRYNDLFSALAAMIYLPAFFAAFPRQVHDFKVATFLNALREEKRAKEIFAELGPSQCPLERSIRYLPPATEDDLASPERITPPELTFRNNGYWKAVDPHEVGEGKNGEKLFGRTWVSQHECYSALGLQSFVLKHVKAKQLGPDPGVIYVQRSPSHEPDLYKVGFTRRSAEGRGQELSSATGVPLPFGLLAKWEVGDCARIEKLVHERLAAFRINPRREFFFLALDRIVTTIENVIHEMSSHIKE